MTAKRHSPDGPDNVEHPDVEVISRSTVFEGYSRVDRLRLRHKIHDDNWSTVVDREVFRRGSAAALIPYDPKTDTIVLIEQFRMGPFITGSHPWMLEVVAGMIDEGETPEEVAVRECLEECGAVPKAVEHVFSYFPSPGAISETIHLYCGHIDSHDLPDVLGLHDEGEYIKVLPVPRLEAEAMLEKGQFNNGLTIMAVQWLKLNHAALRQRWGA